MAEIALSQLTKRFTPKTAALAAIDLTIHSGELLVILGPSGSGKSTLLRLVAGLETADEGSVTVAGHNMTRTPPHQRNMAMVFQNPALYPHLSVHDNLAFGLKLRGIPRGQIRSRVNTIAGILGLDSLLSRRPSALSGGERQRVAIGRAVVREPKVLLFDEPFSSLDLPLRSALRSEVIDIQRRLGTTLIHVTHDQSEALSMGDRIAILDRGRLLQCGTPRQIYDNPTHKMVATFVGNPPMNLLPCRLEQEADQVRVTPLATDHASSFLVPPTTVPFFKKTTLAEVDLGLRPEAIQVQSIDHPTEAFPYPPTIPTQIRRLEFHGPEAWATLSIGPHLIIARLPSSQPLQIHQRAHAILDVTRAIWFEPTSGVALYKSVNALQ